MINRRRFLQDSLLATAGLSIARVATGAGQASPDAPVSFDMHTHPGAFFNQGRPGYEGDAGILKN